MNSYTSPINNSQVANMTDRSKDEMREARKKFMVDYSGSSKESYFEAGYKAATEKQIEKVLELVQSDIDKLTPLGFTPTLAKLKSLKENIEAIRNQGR